MSAQDPAATNLGDARTLERRVGGRRDRASSRASGCATTCPGHRDPHSGQRLVDIADLPEQPRIRAAAVHNGRVRVEWEGDAQRRLFDLRLARCAARRRGACRPEFDARRWLDGADARSRRSDFAWAGFGADARPIARCAVSWLTRLLQDGIAFLRGVPLERRTRYSRR